MFYDLEKREYCWCKKSLELRCIFKISFFNKKKLERFSAHFSFLLLSLFPSLSLPLSLFSIPLSLSLSLSFSLSLSLSLCILYSSFSFSLPFSLSPFLSSSFSPFPPFSLPLTKKIFFCVRYLDALCSSLKKWERRNQNWTLKVYDATKVSINLLVFSQSLDVLTLYKIIWSFSILLLVLTSTGMYGEFVILEADNRGFKTAQLVKSWLSWIKLNFACISGECIYQNMTFRKIFKYSLFQWKLLYSALYKLSLLLGLDRSLYGKSNDFKDSIQQSVSRMKINEARWLFLIQFWPLLKQASFFEAAGTLSRIGSSLKSPDAISACPNLRNALYN